jgi:hypothetical protein
VKQHYKVRYTKEIQTEEGTKTRKIWLWGVIKDLKEMRTSTWRRDAQDRKE